MLSKLSALRVSSRTSVMPYRDRADSPMEIAQALGVTHLLEGSVRVAGHEGEGFQLVETWYGKADGRRHLRAWLRHLAAAVDRPDERLRTFIQARADNSGGVRRFAPRSGSEAPRAGPRAGGPRP